MEMTDEQRYEQQVQMERDKIALLKRIADALDRAFPNVVMKSKDEIDALDIVSLKTELNSSNGFPIRFVTESEKPEEVWK
jgi:hypothetical protein